MIPENLHTGDSIRTFTGKYINVFDPNPDDIDIRDISHALSQMPRFGGRLPIFYSVAQHSIDCTNRVDEDLVLDALLHDASEAYLMDIPKPIKRRLPDYIEVENNLMKVIAEKFKIEYPIHPEVKKVDKEQLEWEWENIMIKNNRSLSNAISQIERQFISIYERFQRI